MSSRPNFRNVPAIVQLDPSTMDYSRNMQRIRTLLADIPDRIGAMKRDVVMLRTCSIGSALTEKRIRKLTESEARKVRRTRNFVWTDNQARLGHGLSVDDHDADSELSDNLPPAGRSGSDCSASAEEKSDDSTDDIGSDKMSDTLKQEHLRGRLMAVAKYSSFTRMQADYRGFENASSSSSDDSDSDSSTDSDEEGEECDTEDMDVEVEDDVVKVGAVKEMVIRQPDGTLNFARVLEEQQHQLSAVKRFESDIRRLKKEYHQMVSTLEKL